MMARDIGGDRAIVSGPLLVAVLLGGLGMKKLAKPVRSERRVMEVTASPVPDGGCCLVAKGSIESGPVAITDDPPTTAETAAAEQALLEDMRVLEGRRESTEDAP